MVKKLEQMVKVAADVEYANRLDHEAYLIPGHNLQQLFESAKATWDGDEGIGKICHLCLQSQLVAYKLAQPLQQPMCPVLTCFSVTLQLLLICTLDSHHPMTLSIKCWRSQMP